MAVINALLAPLTESGSAVPTATVTSVIIEENSTGTIWLQCMMAGGNWVNVTNKRGSYTIPTADYTITYRFQSLSISESTRVYFGAATS
jgi:hypothetical protein